MKISENMVVSIDYTLKDDSGAVVDSSHDQGPLTYIHGSGLLVPGLESALNGKLKGDRVSVSIEPEDGYGPRYEEMVRTVEMNQFENPQDVRPGVQFEVQTESGVVIVNVIDVQDNQVTVDGNHPLAGMVLNFDVTVVDVREATDEELQQLSDHLNQHHHDGSCGCGHGDDEGGNTIQ